MNDQAYHGLALEYGVDFPGRKVYLHGEIDHETCSHALRGLVSMSATKRPIELWISSWGGDLTEAFGLYDVISTLRADVTTIAVGQVMSAAPLIFAAGVHRVAFASTSFMLHQTRVEGMEDATADDLESASVATVEQMERYAEVLAKRTKRRDRRFWGRRLRGRADFYFDAAQALEWGLVDEVR